MAVPRPYNVWKHLKAKIFKDYGEWIVYLYLPETQTIVKSYIVSSFEEVQILLKGIQKIINTRKFPLSYLP